MECINGGSSSVVKITRFTKLICGIDPDDFACPLIYGVDKPGEPTFAPLSRQCFDDELRDRSAFTYVGTNLCDISSLSSTEFKTWINYCTISRP